MSQSSRSFNDHFTPLDSYSDSKQWYLGSLFDSANLHFLMILGSLLCINIPMIVHSTDDIEYLMEAGNWAPTHHKSEPWRYIVISGTKNILGSCLKLNDIFFQLKTYKIAFLRRIAIPFSFLPTPPFFKHLLPQGPCYSIHEVWRLEVLYPSPVFFLS